MSSSGFSSSQGQSSSSTFPIETNENSIMDQIAQAAAGYAGQLYDWAGNVFNQTSQVTNEAVGNFFNTSQQMNQLSKGLTDQYNNLFAPENAQLVADANSYASPARMAVDMGMAGATQAQAGKAALDNSEEALRSYGINPSDGRYAALDQASRVQNAANVAGAENQQRMADIQTGQQLREQAVQVGAQLPSAIANVNNTAIQANTGASNAELANANTGANLYKVPNEYLSTGMNLKLPFSGSQSQSTNSSFGSNSSSGGDSGGSHGGGGGGGGQPGGGGDPFGNSGPAWMPQHGGGMGSEGDQGYAGGGGGDPGIYDVPQQDDGLTDMGDTSGGQGYGDWSGSGEDWGGGMDFGSGGDGMDYGGDYARGGAIPSAPPPRGYSRTHTPHGLPRIPHGPPPRMRSPNFAAGGPVDPSLSPSGGAQTDDVPMQTPAGPGHLNANEYVIPQDVALWKGQEFFQKLIDQSRQARIMGSAKPTKKPGM